MTGEAVPAEDEQWAVYIEWIGRNRINNLTPRQLARRTRRVYRLAGDLTPDGELIGWVDDLAGVLVLLAVLLLIAALGPIALVVLLGVIEVVLAFGLVVGALAWRFLLRRPWRVAAVHESGAAWSWHQVGWRRAKSFVADIERALSEGVEPASIGTGSAEFLGQSRVELVASPPVWTQPWYLWTTRAAAIALLVAGVVAVVLRYVA